MGIRPTERKVLLQLLMYAPSGIRTSRKALQKVTESRQEHLLHEFSELTDETFFLLFFFILGTIRALGSSLGNSGSFRALTSKIVNRIRTNRTLKLLFLLYANNACFSEFFLVNIVRDELCYTDDFSGEGKAVTEKNTEESGKKTEDKIDDKRTGIMKEIQKARQSKVSKGLKRQMTSNEEIQRRVEEFVAAKQMQQKLELSSLMTEAIKDIQKLKLLARIMFCGKDGVKLRDQKYHLRVRTNTFNGEEAVDWILVNCSSGSRVHATTVLQAMLQEQLIKSVHTFRSNRAIFFDKKSALYQFVVIPDMPKNSKGTFIIPPMRLNVTKKEKEKANSSINYDYHEIAANEGETFDSVDSVEITIPVDNLDLQGVTFYSTKLMNVNKSESVSLHYTEAPHLFVMQSHHRCNGRPQEENEDVSPSEYMHLIKTKKKAEKTEAKWRVNTFTVEKVFSSIASPVLLSLHAFPEGTKVKWVDYCGAGTTTTATNSQINTTEIKPRVIAKMGDNLLQDLGCETIFKLFNLLWEEEKVSGTMFRSVPDYPWVFTYEVAPTGDKRGLLEFVPGIEPLKAFDWNEWSKTVNDKDAITMANSAAGSHIAAYVVGARDRHWDNICVKDKRILFHIDFGFLLGSQPPIDAPPFSISKAMMVAFKKKDIWEYFVTLCENAFRVLRKKSDQVLSACSIVFGLAGWDAKAITDFLSSDESLMMNVPEKTAIQNIRRAIESSPTSWQNWFKQFSHKRVDPVFYGLLKKHFPPASVAMKVVEIKDEKKQARLMKKKKTKKKETYVVEVHKKNSSEVELRKESV
eukprot:TRINITY_DN10031_c0_g1_i1.p1 TRINITY_DN10031_c0_g1~~TRINITY_DN10031_c0_g1_i1.p1  ORF type:complete len:889 (+),score=150.82 TRINITY_DN10031_c0_g1_i1:258-2669(+)